MAAKDARDFVEILEEIAQPGRPPTPEERDNETYIEKRVASLLALPENAKHPFAHSLERAKLQSEEIRKLAHLVLHFSEDIYPNYMRSLLFIESSPGNNKTQDLKMAAAELEKDLEAQNLVIDAMRTRLSKIQVAYT